MDACRCTSVCSDSESLINIFWVQLHNQFCTPLEVVAALLMGLLCEAKALLKWSFSVLFSSPRMFTHARFAIGLIKFFSDKSMLPISNVFVIYCGKKKEIEMLAKICKTLFKMYICEIFVWLVFCNKKQSSNFSFNKRTLSIRKSLVWQWGAK